MKQKKERHGLYAVLCIVIAILLLIVDQLTKRAVLADLKPIQSLTVIPGWLEFSYVENTGIAFGLLKNQPWIIFMFTAIAFVVIVILLFRYQQHSFFSYAAAALILSGGAGNLLDRIFYGYVVDFIHVMFFDYVFNFADCCITVSAVFLAIHVFFFTRTSSSKDTNDSGAIS